MVLSIGSGAFRPYVRTDTTYRTAASQAPDPLQKLQDSMSALATSRATARAIEFRNELGVFQDLLQRVRVGKPPEVASAVSSTMLGLSTNTTAATVVSSEEINTATTTYSPVSPQWQQGSQAAPTLGGTYNGAQGSGTLTFTVTSGGIRGLTEARIGVAGPMGEFVDEIVVAPSDPVDTEYPVSNGLTVRLGSGILILGDTFNVDVQSGLDLEINANAAFDGSGGSDPGFDAGEAVTEGSFTVNGIEISVAGSDSVETVLSRINASQANVTANYDDVTETVTLTQKTAGASPTINLSADTSGFLSAVKLDDGTHSPGVDSDVDKIMQDVSAFDSVSSGAFFVNGTAISIDKTVDSLRDIVERTDASAANVNAYLINSQRLSIRNTDLTSLLTLDDNGTNFLQALNIAAGEFAPTPGADRPAESSIAKISEALKAVVTSYNRLFTDSAMAEVPGVADLKRGVDLDFAQTLELAGFSDRELGLDLSAAGSSDAIELVDGRDATFRRALRNQFNNVRAIFVESPEKTPISLVDRLVSAVNGWVQRFQLNSGTGQLISTIA